MRIYMGSQQELMPTSNRYDGQPCCVMFKRGSLFYFQYIHAYCVLLGSIYSIIAPISCSSWPSD